MMLHVFLLLLVFFLILTLGQLCFLGWPHRSPAQATAAKRTPLHRLLKPRSPHDCPACRIASTLSPMGQPPPLRPSREGKTRRRPPPQFNTHNLHCPNPK